MALGLLEMRKQWGDSKDSDWMVEGSLPQCIGSDSV